VVVIVHGVMWITAFALALQIRFDGAVPPVYATLARQTILLLLAARMLAFLSLGLFHGVWRYAGLPELEKIIAGTTLGSAVAFTIETLVLAERSPRSVYIGEWLASLVFIGGARVVLRSIIERRRRRMGSKGLRTLIIGAGDAGESFLRDVQHMRDGSRWTVIGFVDDDQAKKASSIRGVKVLGNASDASIERIVRMRMIQVAVLAIPTAPGWRIREIARACRKAGVETKTVDRLAGHTMSTEPQGRVRAINIEDLLRREPVRLDEGQIKDLVRDRVVLVTGAGGSIGSELCRQVVRFAPQVLLLVDHDENALFQVDRNLRECSPQRKIKPLIADITDVSRVSQIFANERPSLVLHAAAHKHVAMMESNPCEAAKNNVFGTAIVAEAAHVYDADAFVLISTDKAVRPSSVMGCTKRIAEMIVQRFAQKSQTRYVAVRFGNVLDSAGSVVPIFREQIARGGPVTVTHPEASRYFMTIPEASQLVLQAAALGSTGEILLLEMGKPVRIFDLACDLIELSGQRPGIDIEIEFTGLKPGEKLTEELLVEAEASARTPCPNIVVGRISPREAEELDVGLAALRSASTAGDPRKTRELLSSLVPEARLDRDHGSLHVLDSREDHRHIFTVGVEHANSHDAMIGQETHGGARRSIKAS
jgi:FlaA1/EpsC-like NDP-sugar epimerase